MTAVAGNAPVMAYVQPVPGGDYGFDFVVRVSDFREKGRGPTFEGRAPVAFDRSGTHIVLGGRAYGTLELWQIEPRKKLFSVREGTECTAVALSPDATLIASNDRYLGFRIRRVTDGKLLHKIEGDDVTALAFTPDGKRLASTARNGEFKLWDVSTGACLFETRLPTVSASICFMPDGKRFFTGNFDTSIVLWDFETQE